MKIGKILKKMSKEDMVLNNNSLLIKRDEEVKTKSNIVDLEFRTGLVEINNQNIVPVLMKFGEQIYSSYLNHTALDSINIGDISSMDVFNSEEKIMSKVKIDTSELSIQLKTIKEMIENTNHNTDAFQKSLLELKKDYSTSDIWNNLGEVA